MIVLGIESSAHTFSVGIIDNKKVLALKSDMVKTKEGGLIPKVLVEHHISNAKKVILSALKEAGIGIRDVDLISFSQSPGIGSALQVGAVVARILSLKNKIPLVGVNHCIAHLEIARMVTGFKDPVMLYTSGANTQVIAFQEGKYRVFGETLDMGVGNFIDHFGRLIGIGFPAGKKIEELASKGKNYIQLPYTVKGMDVTFGGILTNIKSKIGKYAIEDLCYSMQEVVFAELVEISERALAHCQKNELVLTGGVAANKRLQEMCSIMCKERGAKFKPIPIEYAVDNGVMIAWTGLLKYKAKGGDKIEETEINQRTRTEEVDIPWR